MAGAYGALSASLDFLQCLADGSFSDRDSNRQDSALGVLSSMAFAAAKLSLSKYQTL